MDLKEKIKNCEDVKSETFHVVEWGEDVLLKSFTAWVRTVILDKSRMPNDELDNVKLNELLVINSVYDPETGEKLFTEDDLPWIRNKSGQALDSIVGRLMQINKLASGDVEEEAKN